MIAFGRGDTGSGGETVPLSAAREFAPDNQFSRGPVLNTAIAHPVR